MKPVRSENRDHIGPGATSLWWLMLVAGLMVAVACSSTPPPPDEETTVAEEPDDAEAVEAPAEADEPDEPREPAVVQEFDVDDDIDDVEIDTGDVEGEEDEGEQVASHVDARIESALSSADDGDIEDAIDDLQDLLDEPEGGYLAAYNLGVILDRRGDVGQALQYYVTALQRQPNFSPALTNLIRLYLRAGAYSDAEEVARQFMELRPDNLDHQAAHLEVWLAQGRYEDAVQGARDILRHDVAHVEAMLQMATAKYRLRRYELAEAILERAIQLSPERAEIYYLLGQVALAQDNADGARANFRQAIDLQPRFPEARNNYAVMLHDSGNFQRAIGHLEESLRDAPHDAEAHVNLGNSRKALGHYADAEASYKTALNIDASHGDALFNLGILYLEADVPGYEVIERYEEAIQAFQDYREAVGQQVASEGPVANYINQAIAAIEDEEDRQEALRQAQMETEGSQSDDEDEDEEE